MEPIYMNENRYSYLVGSWRRPSNVIYVAETPEGAGQQYVQELFIKGQAHLQHEEYTLAFQTFQEAMAVILRTVHPTMPIDPNQLSRFRFPSDLTLVDTLVNKTADMLRKTAPIKHVFPGTLMSEQSVLSAQTQQALASITDAGLQVTSFHTLVQNNVSSAMNAADRKDWRTAIQLYLTALDAVPGVELTIRGGLLHDLAVLHEKAGQPDKSQELGMESIKTFAQANLPDARAQALATTSGILTRSGNTGLAKEVTRQLNDIRTTTNLNDVVSVTDDHRISLLSDPMVITSQKFEFNADAPLLMGLKFIAGTTPQKALTIKGTTSDASITLDNSAAANVGGFLKTLAITNDIGLLTGWLSPIHWVAYIPHLYFYVIPMSMGDCHVGMGNLEEAQQLFRGVLSSPFINMNYEIVKVWTRLAQTFLDLGDQAYRNAKDNTAAFTTAKAFYESIVLTNKTLDAASPLYSSSKFGDVKTRVTNFLNAADPVQFNDNPAILSIVLGAFTKLRQIQAELNFFGFGVDYVPPFSFEAMQNTARYFAEHASQVEQRYIQYKSQAENEQFHRDQLAQQAEVAAESVVLEQRGQDEAQAGIDVAAASQSYAAQQAKNATASQTDFENARWELLELTEIEAWASAASVGQDKEVKLTTSPEREYFSADHERRSIVLRDLASQRTQLSQDLEAARLQQAVDSAAAYQKVADKQVDQAKARKAVADQRVQVAQLQQRFAKENCDFLDMREFAARLWYELGQQAQRLKQRYLDMATEIAFLMERAYNAETERGLKVIRYDYQHTASSNLMGADMLLADIDYFTFDHVTTTKNKKLPVKKTISLADSYPIDFQKLKTDGKCLFETRFQNFDREHPGLYLAKIRNVELVFIGITGTTSIAGTLRNIGVSRFRASDASITERLYPADVMALSQYEIRQDALAFRFNPNDLRLFENNGIETLWQIDLPLDANDFDYSEILDVHLILYYDGFFDPTLETSVKATLPKFNSASRAFSMQLSFPDELFFLKNQGEAELTFEPIMFPRNQKDLIRTTNTLKLTGQSQAVQNLTLRLTAASVVGDLILKTDANGNVLDSPPGSPLRGLQGKAMLDRWRIRMQAVDNPQLVRNGVLDLSGLNDLLIFSEYKFTYR
jgi:hypothetical protein